MLGTKLIDRVFKWNLERFNTQFKPEFDIALLSEEVAEFYTAAAKQDLVEMVDAYCDTEFVYQGIQFKYGMIRYVYNLDGEKQLEKNTSAFRRITNYYNYHRALMLNTLIDKRVYTDTLNKCFKLVCDANDAKGTARDEKGKTMKGPNWFNPADAIREVLEARNTPDIRDTPMLPGFEDV